MQLKLIFVFLIALSLQTPQTIALAVEPIPIIKPQQITLLPTLPEPTIELKPTLDLVYVPPATYSDVLGQNTYRDYIFNVESGYSLSSTNPIGCIGLGQDCNGWLITGRLDSPACPDWQTNLTCQLAYWDWYANTVYGGWAGSYAFRSTHNYW